MQLSFNSTATLVEYSENMMACVCFLGDEEGGDQFYDSREDLSSVFDSCPSSPASSQASFQEDRSVMLLAGDPLYHVWIKSPGSIQERRARFMKCMGLDPNRSLHPDSIVPDGELMADDTIVGGFDRISMDFGAVLRESASEKFDEVPSTSQGRSSDEQFECRIENLDYGRMFVVRESNHDGKLLRSNSVKASRRKRFGWLRRLSFMSCVVDKQHCGCNSGFSDSDKSAGAKFQRVRVRSYRKQFKEFSAVYMGQNFRAHHGAILTMKFSLNGDHLASSGEDGVVRVWQVIECARTSEDGILDNDPSCIYFNVSHQSKLSSHYTDREKKFKSKSFLRSSDSAFVVVPPEVFELSDKPLYEFHGHKGDVLDLAWSKDKHLLSCSVDKTVRLWQLGVDGCLQVFAHNNYVTCAQFNPIDDKYFLSGSIDGKVRIWEIPTCRVVNWTDVKQIVTAVCYCPDGKGVVVGSMTGDCRFYDASDNDLQLNSTVSFEGKRKSLGKKITGFQFCPSSSNKLMVTSADSVIRILEGTDVVFKYKGLRNTGSQISATFTSDGKHIVSASEDSNVYIWNHSKENHTPSSNLKCIRSSEHFASSHAYVAIPWQGSSRKSLKGGMSVAENDFLRHFDTLGNKILYLSLSSSFSLGHEFFADIFPRGSATWPEEKLPSSISKTFSLGKSQLKFLRSSCPKNTSHSWGQVIVTAGCDGRIRSFHNYGLPAHL